jgi:hypothetical protein
VILRFLTPPQAARGTAALFFILDNLFFFVHTKTTPDRQGDVALAQRAEAASVIAL